MRSNITNTLVTKLKPDIKPYEVRDLRLKGLLLRVQPSGVMTWYIEYGRGKRASLGRADAITATKAREEAKLILGEAYQGRDPMAASRKAKAHSYREFIDKDYGPWAREHLRSGDGTAKRLLSSFPDLHQKKLGEITPWLIDKWRSACLKAGKKPATINRDLASLKSALNRAVTWSMLDENPIRVVKRSKVDAAPSVRFLSKDEEQALRVALSTREERIRIERDSANAWRMERGHPPLPDLRPMAFADHLKPMVLLSLNTGLRRGELFGLAWADVDMDNANLTVQGLGAKSGRTRHIPLNSEALDTLRGWKEQCGNSQGLIFISPKGKRFDNVRNSWGKVLKDAGIDKFRWHDIRHTFASNLVMAGVDLNTVRELLGHSDYQMTLRYAHLAPQHKADAVARLVGG
ncbi:MAG: site-specific integrase [Alphaproteobacteria bacterium]|nr:site-specific integrase [Alphaproteobacteria bacterium]